MRVFVHGAAATPTPLLDALVARTRRCAASSSTTCTPTAPRRSPTRSTAAASCSVSLFTGPPLRRAIEEGARRLRAGLPVRHPRAVPHRAHPARRRAAAALAARPPRLLHARHLGRRRARRVDSRAGSSSPRSTSGCRARTATRWCRSSRIHAFIHTNRPLHEHHADAADRGRGRASASSGRRARRGRRDAADGHRRHPRRGARAPGRQARPRRPHRDVLRRHPRLVEGGVVTNRHKKVHPGRIVTSFVIGTRAALSTSSTTTRSSSSTPATAPTTPSLIRKNDKVVAINSALEIDLTGQVVRRLDRAPHLLRHRRADGLHPRRGALRGGKPIIALPSTAGRARSRASSRRSSRAPAWSRRAATCTGS